MQALLARLPVSAKTLLSPALVLVLFIASSVFTIVQMNGLESDVLVVTDELTPTADRATEMLRETYRQRLAAADYLFDADAAAREQFESAHLALEDDVQAAAGLIGQLGLGERTDRLTADNDAISERFQQGLIAATEERRELWQSELVPTLDAIDTNLTAYTDTARRSGELGLALQASQLHNQALALRSRLNRHLARPEKGLTELVDERVAAMRSDIATLEQGFVPAAQARRLAEVTAALEALPGLSGRLAQLTEQRSTAANAIIRDIGKRLSTTADGVQETVFERLESRGEVAEEDVLVTASTLGSSTFVAVAVGLVLTWWVSRSITRPLKRTQRMLNDIAEGEGDLTKRLSVEGKDEIGQLADGFNRFVEKLHGFVSQIADATTQIAAAGEQLSSVTADMSRGVNRQKQDTDSVATAMNQMAATVQEVAHSAANAAGSAQQAEDDASAGTKTVVGAIDSIETLADEVEHSGKTVTQLRGESDSIGTVLDVIRGIADQTNLLALNAAIEASRAGDHGRGFAVVADEVRTLAQRTQSSTEEIETMIERLQNGAKQAGTAMESSANRADSTVKQAKEARQSLRSITGAINTISEMNTQIASAAEQQGTVAEDINRRISAIRDVTDETAAGAEQTSASAAELARLGENLRGVVGSFRI